MTLLKSYDLLKDKIELKALGQLNRVEINKILKEAIRVIAEKASQNEPVKIKRLGTFGVYTFKSVPNPSRGRTTATKKGKSTYKENQDGYRGATHYRSIFRPSKWIKGVLN